MREHGTHPPRSTFPGRWVGAAAWTAAAVLVGSAAVRGEDDRPVDDVQARPMQERPVNMTDLGANFYENVFRQTGNGFSLSSRRRGTPGAGDAEPAPESPAMAALRQRGESRLADVSAMCDLSATQQRKLKLAMESDVRRLADDIDLEWHKYRGVVVNLNDDTGQRKWQQFQQDVMKCRQRLLELADGTSLFRKVLETTLDADQRARLESEVESRRACRWQAMVAASMLKFDDVLGIDQRQHEEIERLLLDKQPRLRLDERTANVDVDQRQWLVWIVLAELDAKRLRAIVNDRQWQVVAQWANQGRAMRSHVEAQGLLEKGR